MYLSYHLQVIKLLLVGIVFLCFAIDKIEATGWSSPQALSTGRLRPLVVLDSSGNAVAIWRNKNVGGPYNIQGSSMSLGGSWNTAVDLSDPTLPALECRLGMDGSGNAIATWVGWDGSNLLIYAARYPVGGPWPTYPATVISTAGQNSFNPFLDVDSAGYAIITWVTVSAGVYSTETAVYSP